MEPENTATALTFLSGMLTPLIAIITTYIAYRQYRTDQFRARHEVFERRYQVYDAIREYVLDIIQRAKIETASIGKLNQETNDALFFFGDDVQKYIDKLRAEGARLRELNSNLKENGLPVGPERSQAAEEEAELLNWFTEQFTESKILLRPYLSLRP